MKTSGRAYERASKLACIIGLAAAAACGSSPSAGGKGGSTATGGGAAAGRAGSGGTAGAAMTAGTGGTGAIGGGAAGGGGLATGAAGGDGAGGSAAGGRSGGQGGDNMAGAGGTAGRAGSGGGGGDGGGSAGMDGTGQFTIILDAAAPNHFGAEHAGTTGYAELVDTTGGMKMRVGSVYSTPMTATGYAKWVWENVGVANHTYTIAIFDDSAAMNATCKPADAGWLFQVNMGEPMTADSTFTFPTGHAPRADNTKCTWFPTGPLMGVVPVPAP
jgi:hypothetical protein